MCFKNIGVFNFFLKPINAKPKSVFLSGESKNGLLILDFNSNFGSTVNRTVYIKIPQI